MTAFADRDRGRSSFAPSKHVAVNNIQACEGGNLNRCAGSGRRSWMAASCRRQAPPQRCRIAAGSCAVRKPPRGCRLTVTSAGERSNLSLSLGRAATRAGSSGLESCWRLRLCHAHDGSAVPGLRHRAAMSAGRDRGTPAYRRSCPRRRSSRTAGIARPQGSAPLGKQTGHPEAPSAMAIPMVGEPSRLQQVASRQVV